METVMKEIGLKIKYMAKVSLQEPIMMFMKEIG